MGMSQNPGTLGVHPKIAGEWMFIPENYGNNIGLIPRIVVL
jgi:hypothetical protein